MTEEDAQSLRFKSQVKEDFDIHLPVNIVEQTKCRSGDWLAFEVIPSKPGKSAPDFTSHEIETKQRMAEAEELGNNTFHYSLPQWLKNLRQHLFLLKERADLNPQWKPKAITDIPTPDKDRFGIVIGAGPSLKDTTEEQWEALRKFDGCIVATNKALIPLLDHSIMPEWVVALDGDPVVFNSFDSPILELSKGKVNFLGPTVLDPKVVKFVMDWAKECYWGNPDMPSGQDSKYWNVNVVLELLNDLPVLQHGGNVGTCLTGDTMVFRNLGGVTPISEMNPGEKVFSIDSNTTLSRQNCRRVFDNGFKEVYELKTRTRSIKATDNHLFMVASNSKTPEWKPLKEVLLGDHIVILKQLDDTGIPYQLNRSDRVLAKLTRKGVDTLKPFKKKGCSKNFKTTIKVSSRGSSNYAYDVSLGKCNARLGYIRHLFDAIGIELLPEYYDTKSVLPLETTEDLMELIGIYIGDGSVHRMDSINIATPPEDKARERCIKLIEQVFHKIPSLTKAGIDIHSRDIVTMFSSLDLLLPSRERRIPTWVFTLPHSQIKACLRGLELSDGTTDKNIISLETTSKCLAEDIRVLAITIGLRLIGNTYERTRDIAINGHRYQTTTYRVRWMNECPKKLNYVNSRLNSTLDDHHLTYDVVRSIDYIGIEPVYDIEVDTDHSFIANGIVVHNCAWLLAKKVGCNPIGMYGFNMCTNPDKTWTREKAVDYEYIYNPENEEVLALDGPFRAYVSILANVTDQAWNESPPVRTVNLTPKGALFMSGFFPNFTLTEYIENKDVVQRADQDRAKSLARISERIAAAREAMKPIFRTDEF